jgi:hypothetical protein
LEHTRLSLPSRHSSAPIVPLNFHLEKMLNHLEIFFESLWHKLLGNGPRYYCFSQQTNSLPLNCLVSADLSSSELPWDPWELDPKFFKAMSRWTIDHPETTLDRVLDNICAGIDKGTDLVDLIPNSPFPACSLVKALGYLVKLGAVSHFGPSVCVFSDETV